MSTRKFVPGDWVIYRKTKHSEHPGPRAANVNPARHGEGYSYTIDKFWVVREIQPDGSLLLRTRRGKEHVVSPDDPRLRRANFLQRFFYRSRFESVLEQEVSPPDAPSASQQFGAA